MPPADDRSSWWSGTPRADPQRAAAAVDELARLGVAAVAGEYHSVVARAAAARADALGLPFLCSSAVLDALTEQPADWVARIAPAQSRGWRIYADFLLGAGHTRVAVAAQPSVYWAAGIRILREHLTVVELDPEAVCDGLARPARDGPAAAGRPSGAGGVDRQGRPPRRAPRRGADRCSGRAAGVRRVGGVAGRGRRRDPVPALPARATRPARRARRDRPPRAARRGALVRRLRGLRHDRRARRRAARSRRRSWPRVAVEGTRGPIRFSRTPGISVWQWAWAPIGVVDRDPADPDRFRILHAG